MPDGDAQLDSSGVRAAVREGDFIIAELLDPKHVLNENDDANLTPVLRAGTAPAISSSEGIIISSSGAAIELTSSNGIVITGPSKSETDTGFVLDVGTGGSGSSDFYFNKRVSSEDTSDHAIGILATGSFYEIAMGSESRPLSSIDGPSRDIVPLTMAGEIKIFSYVLSGGGGVVPFDSQTGQSNLSNLFQVQDEETVSFIRKFFEGPQGQLIPSLIIESRGNQDFVFHVLASDQTAALRHFESLTKNGFQIEGGRPEFASSMVVPMSNARIEGNAKIPLQPFVVRLIASAGSEFELKGSSPSVPHLFSFVYGETAAIPKHVREFMAEYRRSEGGDKLVSASSTAVSSADGMEIRLRGTQDDSAEGVVNGSDELSVSDKPLKGVTISEVGFQQLVQPSFVLRFGSDGLVQLDAETSGINSTKEVAHGGRSADTDDTGNSGTRFESMDEIQIFSFEVSVPDGDAQLDSSVQPKRVNHPESLRAVRKMLDGGSLNVEESNEFVVIEKGLQEGQLVFHVVASDERSAYSTALHHWEDILHKHGVTDAVSQVVPESPAGSAIQIIQSHKVIISEVPTPTSNVRDDTSEGVVISDLQVGDENKQSLVLRVDNAPASSSERILITRSHHEGERKSAFVLPLGRAELTPSNGVVITGPSKRETDSGARSAIQIIQSHKVIISEVPTSTLVLSAGCARSTSNVRDESSNGVVIPGPLYGGPQQPIFYPRAKPPGSVRDLTKLRRTDLSNVSSAKAVESSLIGDQQDAASGMVIPDLQVGDANHQSTFVLGVGATVSEGDIIISGPIEDPGSVINVGSTDSGVSEGDVIIPNRGSRKPHQPVVGRAIESDVNVVGSAGSGVDVDGISITGPFKTDAPDTGSVLNFEWAGSGVSEGDVIISGPWTGRRHQPIGYPRAKSAGSVRDWAKLSYRRSHRWGKNVSSAKAVESREMGAQKALALGVVADEDEQSPIVLGDGAAVREGAVIISSSWTGRHHQLSLPRFLRAESAAGSKSESVDGSPGPEESENSGIPIVGSTIESGGDDKTTSLLLSGEFASTTSGDGDDSSNGVVISDLQVGDANRQSTFVLGVGAAVSEGDIIISGPIEDPGSVINVGSTDSGVSEGDVIISNRWSRKPHQPNQSPPFRVRSAVGSRVPVVGSAIESDVNMYMRFAAENMQKGKLLQAYSYARQAVDLKPELHATHRLLCTVLATAGQAPQLLSAFRAMFVQFGEVPADLLWNLPKNVQRAGGDASSLNTLCQCFMVKKDISCFDPPK